MSLCAERRPAAGQICNAAEWLLHIDDMARVVLSYGASLEETAECLEVSGMLCDLAIRFAAVRDSLKLRALVEDWNLSTILHELHAAELAADAGN